MALSTDVDIKEVVRQEVSLAIALVKQEVEERLGEFAASLAEGESLGQELKPDSETICDRTFSILKMGRQQARRLMVLLGSAGIPASAIRCKAWD